jgi:hypothetical protein
MYRHVVNDYELICTLLFCPTDVLCLVQGPIYDPTSHVMIFLYSSDLRQLLSLCLSGLLKSTGWIFYKRFLNLIFFLSLDLSDIFYCFKLTSKNNIYIYVVQCDVLIHVYAALDLNKQNTKFS